MFFDSPVYIAFLALVVALYWQLQRTQQNQFLLAASYFFYGWWDWRFLLLIALSTVVDFFCARFIAASTSTQQRRGLLTVALVLNLGFLGFFKYCNFFIDSLVALLETLGVPPGSRPVLAILLPPGISFYTFQEVAYLVDVYHGRLRPARSLIDYALFISLFPHLIAGPIQRPDHLLPQVEGVRRFNSATFFDGLMLIVTGLFRKCVVADNCALIADAAFSGRLGSPSLPVLALGTYAFAWQIYGDFSGYSNIARGSAQLLGFHFMVNFRQPYFASSLQDFWRRWHISLSSWLRDYLYIPLGGSRHGALQTYRNLLLTMVLGGLWHGANWTFIVWGAIHGVGLSLERLLTPGKPSQSVPGGGGMRAMAHAGLRILQSVIVFHIVCLTWVFFRADSVASTMYLLQGIAVVTWRPEFEVGFRFLAFHVVALLSVDLLNEMRGEEYVLALVNYPVRVAMACTVMMCIALFSGTSVNAFIYFQF
jgi:D-alanyl-lipoteichoic acid acyltransferase DltB (MBOAT superfamily)